jgi:hypothetical protein
VCVCLELDAVPCTASYQELNLLYSVQQFSLSCRDRAVYRNFPDCSISVVGWSKSYVLLPVPWKMHNV